MKKLVIVGTGISGLASAYLLRNNFEITLIDKNDYIGGHTHTHYYKNENIHYDSGFIVLNNKNYPNLIKLLKELDVELTVGHFLDVLSEANARSAKVR